MGLNALLLKSNCSWSLPQRQGVKLKRTPMTDAINFLGYILQQKSYFLKML